ncbi:ImmA/IrrE family metallo-endopeptidase [Schlegelella sp. S2-27]|uniref:ImmA/IrrE family metallo-endopeptidase n=1 Tax=Caldimonas mangrovi TaxID=2944811 RepID=A0ABT0YKU5_9BURK|nr:ImmA/IrrE family metallo-endopeptidase [Caldimonas mangrovi]MCM5679356.1 ImmA/IrrE family metallo-endopeptidase [Caldimonas mangrovi]
MAAIQTRMQFGMGANEPLCIYELCNKLGIKVRFVDINIEGMYRRGADPRIMVAAKRPVARRAFTCAHELGHHVFGHGSTVDELEDDRSKDDSERPEEILANSFAAFTLMPTVGVRHAFASRHLAANTATPVQIFGVACNFGVGYSTLVNHLAYGMNDLLPVRATELLKSSPKTIRAQLLGKPSDAPLVVADGQWSAKTLDIEVGSHLLLPKTVAVAEGVMEPIAENGSQVLYCAVATGIRRAHGPNGWATFIRVCRERYVGMAAYRHLEDNDDEDDE